MNKSRLLVIDLDGTLCDQTRGGDEYASAAPRSDVIARVNSLWADGWHVTIHTARGMRTCRGDVRQVERLFRQMTIEWLDRYQVKYDELLFGKPPGDVYVDDRGMKPDEFAAAGL